MTESQFYENLVILITYTVISFSVCLKIAFYIIDKTKHKYLAYFIYPAWIVISCIILLIYLFIKN